MKLFRDAHEVLHDYELQLTVPLWLCIPTTIMLLLLLATTVFHFLERPNYVITHPSSGQCNCALIAAYPDGAFGGPAPLKQNR